MENVGYILMDRARVLDGEGGEEEVLSLNIRGVRYGIRTSDMEALLAGGGAGRVERLRRNWRYYLDGVEGVAELSRSGKAVNLELFGSRSLEPSGLRNIGFFTSERYTISLRALQAVFSGGSRYAMVAEVPGEKGRSIPRRPQTTYQLRIPVTASS